MCTVSTPHSDLQNKLHMLEPRYRQVSERVETLLAPLLTSTDYCGHVARIYTRAEKQNGQLLKETWKIAATMAKHGYKELFHVHDIIGATIVVPYPSDVNVIRDFVRSHKSDRTWAIHHEEEKTTHGYYAFHFIISIPEATLAKSKCEIQIKTVLQDAWSAKTHDLTYKPFGAIDSRLQEQIIRLAEVLAAIDRQSELVKSLIEEKWFSDATRRKIAIDWMMLSTPIKKSATTEPHTPTTQSWPLLLRW